MPPLSWNWLEPFYIEPFAPLMPSESSARNAVERLPILPL
jgi:hypothetical protein